LQNRTSEIGEIDGVGDYFLDIYLGVSVPHPGSAIYTFEMPEKDIVLLHGLKLPFACAVAFSHDDVPGAPPGATVIQHCCDEMINAVEREEIPLNYWHAFREYGIRVLDGTESPICLEYCPWCTTKLPATLRYRWFAELERRGIDPNTDTLPEDFVNDTWHQG
jgi:hypothetical protein